MSKVKIEGNASGTGTLTISAPNTNTDRSLTLPDVAGEILTDAGVPVSAMPSGSVIQVVSDTLSTQFATTSTSYSDVGLSLSITPSSASNKILIQFVGSISISINGTPTSVVGEFQLTDASNSSIMGGSSYIGSQVFSASAGNRHFTQHGFTYLDSPSSTSALTYKVRARCNGASQQVQIASTAYQGPAQLIAMEIVG